MPQLTFDPSRQIPNLSGKVILITGGTAGLGHETALSFAEHSPANIIFTGRSQSSADKLIEKVESNSPGVPIEFVKCDLASLNSVQTAAKEILSKTSRLDILMANAGVMCLPPGKSEDGYEVQFGTNHMGHALLVKLLTPLLKETAKETKDVRIVWNTSQGYQFHTSAGIHFDTIKTPQPYLGYILSPWFRYGQSKLANLLYARAYAKHHPSIVSVSIHPGISFTGLVTSLGFFNRWFVYLTTIGQTLTAKECAWNQQWAATAPLGKGNGEVESGIYYEPVGVREELAREARNDQLAEKLWEWTSQELEGYSL